MKLDIQSTCLLNDNTKIPYLGLGVWASSTCAKACLTSFDEGYRHIDTAQLYGNEKEVGVGSNLHLYNSPILIVYLGSHQVLLIAALFRLRHLESLG